VNVADGSIRWRLATNNEAGSPALRVLGRTVYVGTGDGQVSALNGDSGTVQWHQTFPGVTANTVLVPGDGAIYVSTGPKTVYDHVPYVTYALDAASGSVRWQAQASAVFLVQGAVYAWVHTAGLYPSGITLLDAASGVAQWTYRPNPPLDSTTHLQAPTLADGRLYVGTWDDTAQGATGPLYALDAQTGRQLWRHETQGEIIYPVVEGPSVYVSTQSANRAVTALEPRDGSVRWSVPITPRIPDDLGDPSELLVAGGVVYFSSDGVYELDATDGTVIAHYLTGEGVDAVPLLVGDTVYASASGSAQSSFAEHTYAAVFAVTRQGSARTLRWQVKLPSGSVGQIVPTAQAVYVASWGDGMYAVSVADGAIRWKFHAGKNSFTDPRLGP
ncbi:MAG TPA: PQQ-binding-like beta-propeller repeat protein, partial [Ktedonobacterales bacterium]|nr:PQQ-binding-like beta-propeller repeat protein [Ktedonobacterales bacterium]